jgi:hypothetical protein
MQQDTPTTIAAVDKRIEYVAQFESLQFET